MRTVVLEHPRITSEKRFNDIANTPLWSCLMGGYAAASLEQGGFDTLFLDDAVPLATFNTTKEKILDLAPDLLCVNGVYFWEHTPALFDLFTTLKSQGFSGHINLFGFFPSLVYRKIIGGCEAVDSIAVGEFENSLVELARAIKNKLSLENIEGIALKSCLLDNKSRARTPEKNLDLFPFPKRSSLEGTVTILASRGCYNHCSFCPVPTFYNEGSLWRGRSPGNIAKEIQGFVDQGVKEFYFSDPNFIGPGKTGKKRIMDLMDLLKPMKIRFGMETRPQDLDDAILEKLINSGFESLLMGVESGSKNVLSQINKSSGATVASRAIALCRKHGIEPEIGFLMFVPDSSLDDLQENLNFLLENNLLDRLDRTANLLSHSQIVLAGTSGYGGFEKDDRLKKAGVFGFEADVTFLDPGVKWVANLLTFGCHIILRSMADSRSPIFWNNEDKEISQKANTFLVDLCVNLLDQIIKQPKKQEKVDIDTKKEEIKDQLISILA